MSTTRNVVAFGEALWDLYPSGPVLGGAPLNFAYRCATLGESSAMVSRIGSDELGRRALAEMQGLGLGTSYLQRDGRRPTGSVVVRVDARGNPDFTIVPEAAYDYIELEAGLVDLVAGCDCLCFGTLAQRGAVSRSTLRELLRAFRGRYLVLDINLRRDCWTPEVVRSSIAGAHVLKMNDAEAPEVGRACALRSSGVVEIARELVGSGGLELCVVTLGENGCFAASGAGEAVYEPAYEVRLVDTCGSGDAFTAAFLHALLEGRSLREACRAGNALGGMVSEQSGATGRIGAEELRAFASSRPLRRADGRFLRFSA